MNTSVKQHCCTELARQRHHITTRQSRARNVRQVYRDPAAWLNRLDRVLMHLKIAHTCLEALGQNLYLLSHFKGAIDQCAGDNGAKTAYGKHAINGKTGARDVLAR